MSRIKVRELSNEQKALRRRILEISHKASYSHLGSCLSNVDLIEAVYKCKSKDDIFVLSNGHAGVALYAVLEKYGFITSKTIKKFNVHPDRDLKKGIHVSTGSLGQGLPIAVGMALSDRSKYVYCSISDGECAEGSIWEALRIANDLKLDNLRIIVNVNGWGAYHKIDIKEVYKRLKSFGCNIVRINGHDIKTLVRSLTTKSKGRPLLIFAQTVSDQLPFLNGLDAHYYVMKDKDYKLAMEILK